MTSRLHDALVGHGAARRGGETSRAEEPVAEDEVDEAGLESFPASDPPNWTLGVDPHERRR